ncbi:MAG: DNA polymerase IV, partial [Thermodesulfobacteriota bacterium]
MKDRTILHLDMDAFYASVEVLDRPELAGRPVIVGGSGSRSVVAAASYEARALGVHSAQPMARARQLCPHGSFLPVRMGRYRQVSASILAIFLDHTPLVEPLSLDEAFLDVTASQTLFGPAAAIAARIKARVRAELGLTVSAGVAPTKLVAKIASDLEKPDGLTIVPADQVQAFLAPLPVGRLWGVGATAQRELALLGVRTIGDLARLPVEVLRRRFGQAGQAMHDHALGLDERPVEPERPALSLGREETFEEDITDRVQAEDALLGLAMAVARRLRRHGLAGR